MFRLGLLVVLVFSTSVFADYSSKVLKVTPEDEGQLQFLRDLHNNPQVDFWKDPSLVGRFVEFRVPKTAVDGITVALDQAQIAYEITVGDVDSLLRKERDVSSRRKRAVKSTSDVLTEYSSHTDINAYLADLCNGKSLCKVETIGQSLEGRAMDVVKISSGGSGKPVIFIDGGVHAREWISPATALNMADKLVSGYGTDSEVTELVDYFDWYVIPVVNPDGYEYSHSTERLWRKNRRVNSGSSCKGVDLNRNFGYEWGGDGTSSNKCSEIYKGTTAFSEPESRALKSFFQSDISSDSFAVYLSFHSYGQYWLHSWGYGSAVVANEVEIARVAGIAATAIYNADRTYYDVGSAARLLYAAAGGSDDYAKYYGADYSYTVELPPVGSGGGGFVLPESKIPAVTAEMWVGVKAMAKAVKDKRESL